jgi:hypothetical protein
VAERAGIEQQHSLQLKHGLLTGSSTVKAEDMALLSIGVQLANVSSWVLGCLSRQYKTACSWEDAAAGGVITATELGVVLWYCGVTQLMSVLCLIALWQRMGCCTVQV